MEAPEGCVIIGDTLYYQIGDAHFAASIPQDAFAVHALTTDGATYVVRSHHCSLVGNLPSYAFESGFTFYIDGEPTNEPFDPSAYAEPPTFYVQWWWGDEDGEEEGNASGIVPVYAASIDIRGNVSPAVRTTACIAVAGFPSSGTPVEDSGSMRGLMMMMVPAAAVLIFAWLAIKQNS